MSVYLKDDMVLLDSGSVATDADCCCGGVCCSCEDGSCDGTTNQVDCEEAGNQWVSGVTCDDDPEPCDDRATGACCNDADCTITTEVCCENNDGIYQGDDTTCDPNPCVTGACCVDGVCSITTEAGCSGTYMGDDTTCDPNPCVTGACCDHGDCYISTSEDCTGVYQGDATDCDPNPCSQECDCSFYNPDDGIYYTTRIRTSSGTAVTSSGGVYVLTYAISTNADCECTCEGAGTFDSGPPFFQHCDYTFPICGGSPDIDFFSACSGCGWEATGGCGAVVSGVTEECDFSYEYADPCPPPE